MSFTEAELQLLGKKLYTCEVCRVPRLLSSFGLTTKKPLPKEMVCKDCVAKQKEAEKPVKVYDFVCPCCEKGQNELEPNGHCADCNIKNGLRWCESCKEVYPVDVFFYQNQAPTALYPKILRTCKVCYLKRFNAKRSERATRSKTPKPA